METKMHEEERIKRVTPTDNRTIVRRVLAKVTKFDVKAATYNHPLCFDDNKSLVSGLSSQQLWKLKVPKKFKGSKQEYI